MQLPLGYQQVSASAADYAPGIGNGGSSILVRDGDEEAHRVDFVLAPGGAQLSGVVLDATGGPVADATVRVMFRTDEAPLGVKQHTKTDDQGRFALTCQAGHVHVVATAEGYAPGEVGRSAPSKSVELILTPAATISGRVETPDGAPLAGIVVIAQDQLARVQQSTSDMEGRFRIDSLVPGIYQLRAVGDRWLGQAEETVAVDLGESADGVLLVLQPGARVSGTLTDAADRPCSDGRVFIGPHENDISVPALHEIADPNGVVSFDAVPKGSYQVTAVCTHGEQPQVLSSLMVEDGDLTGLTWQVRRMLTISGKAVDDAGEPVTALGLELADSQGEPAGPMVRTDAKGEFVFRSLSPSGYVITAGDLITPVSVDLSAGRDQSDVKILADRLGDVVVRVLDPAGEPVDGLSAFTVTAEGYPSVHAKPAGDGRYLVGPLRAGSHALYADDGTNPLVAAAGSSREVQVRAGETTHVDVRLDGAFGRITGRVRDQAGAPLANVWVRAEPADTQQDGERNVTRWPTFPPRNRVLSNTDGTFELDRLREDATFVVVAERPLGGRAKLESVQAGEDVEIVLESLGSIAGTAVDASGAPVQNLMLQFRNERTGQSRAEQVRTEGGVWRLDDVTPGPVELLASDLRAQDALAAMTLQLSPSQRLDGVRLELRPRGTD
jgi:protocatechuate 3,4-dioxygenase beta subunit